jgi:hypothetical protein
MLVAGAFLTACGGGATAPTATPGQTESPSRPSLVAPTVLTTPEPPTPEPTASAEPAPTPTPTERPERTLAPGETPTPTPIDISAFLTATLSIVNLTDEQFTISVDIYSDGENQGTVARFDLEPYGSLFQNVPETTYAVSAVSSDGSGEPSTCVVTIAEGAQLSFTLIGTDILIADAAHEPTSPEDLFVATSSLCER